MVRGTVLFNTKLKFQDGEIGEKLLIILNNSTGESPFLCCKTTSKQKYNILTEGCFFEKNIFFTKRPPFKRNTWIQFDPTSLFEFSKEYFLQGSFNKNIEIIGIIPENEINAIVNCVKKSFDISKYYLRLLNT